MIPSSSITFLPEGEARTDETVKAMFALVKHARSTGLVDALAKTLSIGKPRGFAQANALFNWLRGKTTRDGVTFANRVRFRLDTLDVEEVTHPDLLLGELSQAGEVLADCKKLATLACAVLDAMGLGRTLVVMRDEQAQDWMHVSAMYTLPNMNYPQVFDPQETRLIGTWPRGVWAVKIYQG